MLGLQQAYDECQANTERRAEEPQYDSDCQNVEQWYGFFNPVVTDTQQEEDVDDENTQDGDDLGP